MSKRLKQTELDLWGDKFAHGWSEKQMAEFLNYFLGCAISEARRGNHLVKDELESAREWFSNFDQRRAGL